MMKKIIYVVLLYLPLFLFSQINTDDLNLANKISLIDEENILRNSIQKEQTLIKDKTLEKRL